jgi:hypothetical protein
LGLEWAWDGSHRRMGWVMVEGLVVHGRWCPTTRLDRRTVAGKIFRPVFRRVFPAKKRPFRDCLRACAALAWFCPSLTVLSDTIGLNSFTIDIIGLTDVRRMSGDRIASVCRLHARASNYKPTIQISFFHEHIYARCPELRPVLRT